MQIPVPNSWGVERLREYNPNHEPAGTSKGGQFARGKSAGWSAQDDADRAAAGHTSDSGATRRFDYNASGMLQLQDDSGLYGPYFPTAAILNRFVDANGLYFRDDIFPTTQADANAFITADQARAAASAPDAAPGLFDGIEGPMRVAPGTVMPDAVADEPSRLFAEPPVTKKKGAPTTGTDNVQRVSNRADDSVLIEMGIDDAEALAEELVSGIVGETFDVSITTSGESTNANPDAPDPDDVRESYDEWYGEAVSEAEGEQRAGAQREYLRAVESEAGSLQEIYDEVRAEYKNLPIDEDLERVTDHVLGMSDEHGEGMFNNEGSLIPIDRVRQRMRVMFDAAVADGVGMPETFDGDLDRDDVRQRSYYFNDDNGFDMWLEDGMTNTDGIPSFDSWYSDQYGIDPSEYGESSGEVDRTYAKLNFVYTGSKGTHIERTFQYEDDALHVHHDYFKVGENSPMGEGVGKALFSKSVPAYERLGVESISVYANIDLGGYAWARYGFVSDLPRASHSRMTGQLQVLKAQGILTDTELRVADKVLSGDDRYNVWAMSDMRIFVGTKRATAALPLLDRQTSGRHHSTAPVWNKLNRQDAAKGIINLGRHIMANMESWSGHLWLTDPPARARLADYIGI